MAPFSPLQLFDPATWTYTYVIFDEVSREAIMIDPVDSQLARDLSVLKQYGLRLKYVMETHAHADHITSAGALIEHTGAIAATPMYCNVLPAAIQLKDGDVLEFGTEKIEALHTSGHTAGSMSFVWRNHVFTGDTLLIGGCGRTDFQSGSAEALYDSITLILFQLPDDTIVWPAHDYKGQTQSSVGYEKQHNPRLNNEHGERRSKASFVALMNALHLPKPHLIDQAVPANLMLGVRHDAGANDTMIYAIQPSAGYAGDISAELAHQWMLSGNAVLVDIRTDAERAWVGFVPDALGIEWKTWPSMALNPNFDAELTAAVPAGASVMLLCRSGVRSIAAAKQAQSLGYTAYNILEGFEGDPDGEAHRGQKGGWRLRGLPWRQN
ncbi:MAG: MBL fold metallo-hydrolase [Cytophagales bacterium]|nr:MBL fold metallo-hydrolase [Cytophagales bacterium]